jgi:hypothetical protein
MTLSEGKAYEKTGEQYRFYAKPWQFAFADCMAV